MALVIPEKVSDLFYVCEDGHVRNKINRRNGTIAAGNISGFIWTKKDKDIKYRQISLDGKRFYAHRIAWFLHYNEQPPAIIDHIDGDGFNNSKDNLRSANSAQNRNNSKLSKNNTSGVKGVYWNTKRRKWSAQIWHRGRSIKLGQYSSLQEASKVVKEARIKYHKEFANEGV